MSQTTIQIEWTKDDVLTDVTSAVLSDPTATFGVKRTDTSAVVVADGTALTKLSTGVYRHVFTDPAAGLTYNYWLEVVFEGQTYQWEENASGPPTNTGESTMSVAYTDLQSEVGHYLSYEPDTTVWQAFKTNRVDAIIQRGLRAFYFPPPLPGERQPHEWTFLRPLTTLTTAADDFDYAAPDDFGGLDGDMTFATTDAGYQRVKQVGEQVIRQMRQGHVNVATGPPRMVAVVPLSTDGSDGQRFEFRLWPTPNAVYTLGYRYNILMDKLTTGNPHVYGGLAHGETILQSCLAIAEQQVHGRDASFHTPMFKDRLAASIGYDRHASTPENFGMNRDTTDHSRRRFAPGRHVTDTNVTYQGVQY